MAEEISQTETDLIAMIKTTGKEKDYELIEYILDVNTQYTQVLMELNENGAMDGAYTYGTARLTEDRFTGESNFYLYDPAGNVAGITDQDGYLWQSYRYDAFGNATFGSPQYDNEYTFNAESYNPNIHSQYLRARYYDTVKGSFLTEDSYLGDIRNPLFYCDPSGYFPTDYEVTDNVRERIEKDVFNDNKGTRLHDYQLYELYEEKIDAYEGRNYLGLWDAIWYNDEEQRISHIEDLDYENPIHRQSIKLSAEIARLMSETKKCIMDDEAMEESSKKYYYDHNIEQVNQIKELTLNDIFLKDIENFKKSYFLNKGTYIEISRETDVPPVLIAAMHYRESGNDFSFSIRNGQDPVSGTDEFVSDAKQWLKKGMSDKDIKITQDASLVMMLTYAELHNGTGYVDNNHINPYLYSGTDIYVKGKYVDVKRPDGSSYSVYKEDVVDAQVGVYALLMSIDKEDWYLYDEKIKFYNN